MFQLVTKGLEMTRTGTAATVGLLAGLERHERDAVEAFLRHPHGGNLNVLATFASVEYAGVEELFSTLPDQFVWKEGGKWRLLVPA
jgi:hypothetical protein